MLKSMVKYKEACTECWFFHVKHSSPFTKISYRYTCLAKSCHRVFEKAIYDTYTKFVRDNTKI